MISLSSDSYFYGTSSSFTSVSFICLMTLRFDFFKDSSKNVSSFGSLLLSHNE